MLLASMLAVDPQEREPTFVADDDSVTRPV